MPVNSNTSKIPGQMLLNEFFGYEPRSEKNSAKRDFSESVQAALSSGLSYKDLQAILDAALACGHGAKEVQ